MDALVILIPLLPLLGAAVIGIGQLGGFLTGENRETITADTATWSLTLAALMAVTLLAGDLLGKNHGYFSVGQWLGSDNLNVRINFTTTGFNARLAALFAVLLAVISRHASQTLHRNPHFHRHFFILNLFAAALLLLVLSANMVGTLFGWELAGVCAYLMVAHQGTLTDNPSLTVHIGQRIGDVGFIMGISLSYAWLDSVNWAQLQTSAAQLSIGEATGLSLCFALAASAKAAQLPFTPWLARTVAQPLPLSLLLIHAGVFLVYELEPVFMQSPFARAVLGFVGLATTLYCAVVAKTQTDSPPTLIFATLAQIGLMFVECALGFWQLAGWHLCAGAVVSCAQALALPTLAQDYTPRRKQREVSIWLYQFSLQQGWLAQLTDWALVKPVRGLAHDLSYFDDRIVDRLMGIRAIGDASPNTFAQDSGLAGQLIESSSTLLHWLEQRFVWRGSGQHARRVGRKIGHAVNQFEQLILRPRYLVLFVCITFLVAF
jgi:NADH:ubiquinone oxidoreductase subunit 5 (subunit L)/multisubunit Na+/H+ antiporter MnhA subunit